MSDDCMCKIPRPCCGVCGASLEGMAAEIASLRDRLARLANSVHRCNHPCAQCQTLARWCTEGLGLPPVDDNLPEPT